MTLARRHHLHYCRWCTFTRRSTAPADALHAHILTYWHVRDKHEGCAGHMPNYCTKYCPAIARPEEITAGERLYGPGARRISEVVPVLKTYEEIFREEDDV